MKKNKINLSREQLEEAIQLFNRSMDDYLYLFDIQNDYYSISKHAVNRFCLPNYHFCDATKAHNYFVYEDDLPLLFDEFNKIKSGEITEHSLHYRWLDRQHNPVWIDCRGDVILDEFNKPLYLIGCVNEIGKRQKADNISGLLREPSLEEYVSSKSKNNITGYFMQIGIDDFEEINGRFGLKCGDEILKQFSRCMQSCINENQKIYELGNGRFMIMDLVNHSKEDILELYVELQNAVDHNFKNFDIYYQPIIDIHTRNLIGAEALMRFKMKRNEQIEFVSPAEFISILEESGLIIPAGRWILRQAVACCKKWQEFIPEFKMNVNLSYVQIIKSSILDEIKQALKDYNLKPALLGIEVTESGYLENTYHYKKLWSSLKEEGITLVLDDYGTGYSNAYRLSNLTPHYIKIDRVLTQKALSSNYERSILIYIIEMAHSLKLNVCIEGVETEEELQEIKKLNPDYIQGYLFGKPVPEDEFYNRQIKKK